MRLTEMEKKKIEEKAMEVLAQFGYSAETDSYVDVIELAKKQGFIVGNANLDDNEDGFLAVLAEEKSKTPKKIVGVNSVRAVEEKRFIIAHELGHFFMHYESGETILHRENRKGKNSDENDVDYFAAVLLMPESSFKREYETIKKSTKKSFEIYQKLSEMFLVPFESVVRRVDECSLA